MTGGPVCLRRWGGCNLHWYVPRRFQHELYGGKSPHCCGWNWLETIVDKTRISRLSYPFYLLCGHVHTKHRERFNLNLFLQRAFVRATGSRELDERLHTDVYYDAHLYRIRVTTDSPTTIQLVNVMSALKDSNVDFGRVPWRPVQSWLEWDQRGSNSYTAMKAAQARLREAWGTIGGTSWENPVRITEVKS